MVQTYKLTLPAVLISVLTLTPIHNASAGPLEDGVRAYSHADYPAAVRMLTPLAERGNSDAQYTLGLIYQKGENGVSVDKVKAHLWFDLAARTGDTDAASERDREEGDMKPDEITESKRLADDWKSK